MTIDTAIHALRTGTAGEQIFAQIALKQAGAAAVAPLLSVLNDKTASNDARWRAVETLGWIGGDDLLPTLRLALFEDESAEVCDLAAWSIGEIGRRGSAGALPILSEFTLLPTQLEQTSMMAGLAWLGLDRASFVQAAQAGLAAKDEKPRRVAHSMLAAARFV